MPAKPPPVKKDVVFEATSLRDLKDFPRMAQHEAGVELDRLQRGLEPNDWKHMPIIGSGAREIRVRDAAGAFRVIYVAKFSDAIYVLHAFRKTSRRTEQSDIDLAARRYKNLERKLK